VANINQIALVVSVKSPLPDFVLLDKLLITVMQKELNAIICINKIDLDEGYKDVIIDCYKGTGVETVCVSSVLNVGFEQLAKMLEGKTTVFAGQSGVGKSTILNKILDSYVMETGEISDKIERGRHTTRHAELLELKSGGFVVTLPALVLLNFRKLNRKNFKTIILSLETISANVDLPDAAISVNPDVWSKAHWRTE